MARTDQIHPDHPGRTVTFAAVFDPSAATTSFQPGGGCVVIEIGDRRYKGSLGFGMNASGELTMEVTDVEEIK